MNMSNVNNTYALAMNKDQAKELDIVSISDLADYVNNNPGELTMASDAEFANRPDGLPGVEELYGFKFGSGQIKQMDLGLTQRALNNRQVDVSVAFETDATIVDYDLVTLKDDKKFFPPYHAAPVVREEILKTYPELREALAPLGSLIDNTTMRVLNYEVNENKRGISELVTEFLQDKEIL